MQTILNSFQFLAIPTGESPGSYQRLMYPQMRSFCSKILSSLLTFMSEHFVSTFWVGSRQSLSFLIVFNSWLYPPGGHRSHIRGRFTPHICTFCSKFVPDLIKFMSDNVWSNLWVRVGPSRSFSIVGYTHLGVTRVRLRAGLPPKSYF